MKLWKGGHFNYFWQHAARQNWQILSQICLWHFSSLPLEMLSFVDAFLLIKSVFSWFLFLMHSPSLLIQTPLQPPQFVSSLLWPAFPLVYYLPATFTFCQYLEYSELFQPQGLCTCHSLCLGCPSALFPLDWLLLFLLIKCQLLNEAFPDFSFWCTPQLCWSLSHGVCCFFHSTYHNQVILWLIS